MLRNEEIINDIRLAFAVVQGYIRPGGSANLMDINIHAEDFVGDILNRLHGMDFENTNVDKPNYPCIDLIDRNRKIGIQVTAEKGVGKINDTIDCLRNHKMADKVKQLKIFSLIPKQGTYAVSAKCDGVAFAWRKDIEDFDGLWLAIKNTKDAAAREAVHQYVTKALPSVFASQKAKLETIRDQLKENINVFNRDVMQVAERFEEPVLMYRAIREMRISLQQSGASLIANEQAASFFSKARDILGKAEQEVRDKYPYIHEAAMTLRENETLPYDKYPGNEYYDSIRLMMEIRPKLESGLSDIKEELNHIESQL